MVCVCMCSNTNLELKERNKLGSVIKMLVVRTYVRAYACTHRQINELRLKTLKRNTKTKMLHLGLWILDIELLETGIG